MEDEHAERKKPLWQRALGLLTGFLTGEYAGDKPLEPKKLLRTLVALLAGFLIGNYVANWHVIRDHGFKAVRYDHFLLQSFGAMSGMIGVWLVGRRKEITTLGIGEATAKKLQ